MRRLFATALVVAIVIAEAACGSQVRGQASVTEVKSAFSDHGLPLARGTRAQIAGIRVTEFAYNPTKLVTTSPNGDTVFHGQFLIVLVFENTTAAARVLRDPREQRAIRAYGLTVIAQQNVVATILRGEATRDRVARVRAAIETAVR